MDLEASHRHAPRSGVLLLNLGTPDAPNAPAIRRYLRQFLSDRRVVELFRPLWLAILYLFVLPFRPKRLAHAYSQVWLDEGSPLLVYGRRLTASVAHQLQHQLGTEVPVALAMTYGNPSIEAGLAALEAQGVRRVLALPLYPQYSATTHAAAYDALFDALKRRRWVPELLTVNGYHDQPAYLAALAASVRTHWQQQGRGEHLLMSFHSIPRDYLEAGDPYYCFCHKTARLLATELGLSDRQWSLSFQSRLGNQPWLQPYSDVVIPQLARRGVRQLDVICPGFSADCLETLEEVALRYGADFTAAGGEALRYIPALNDHPDHAALVAGLCLPALALWQHSPPSAEPASQRLARAQAAQPSLDRPGLG
jgi:ferrochelatase